MFKQRLLTGLILIAAVLLAIFYLPVSIFITMISAIFLFAAWEWGGIVGFSSKTIKTVYALCFFPLFYVVWSLPVMIVLIVTSIFWLIAIFFVVFYPRSENWGLNCPCFSLLVGMFVLLPCWLAINQIRLLPQGSILLLTLLLLVWAADTGAYFSGKFLGKHKLSPSVSPKKTWEGLWGGVILALIIAILMGWVLNINVWVFLVIALMTTLFSTVGDLLESVFKRHSGLKDSGHYLPGHGGILDRMDSLTAAAPIFLLGWICLHYLR